MAASLVLLPARTAKQRLRTRHGIAVIPELDYPDVSANSVVMAGLAPYALT
jgi:hypothetical protein